ncbi:MAG: hypothetical protein ACYTGB_17730 [Planctomycetota bacterium]
MSRRGGVLLHLGLAVALVAAARPVEAYLVRLRGEKHGGYRLADFAPRGGRPAAEAISTACLGGLRGIIADLLWMRAIRMEEEGRGYEIIALLDGILEMQPHFASVWIFQARVLAFDFGSSLESPDPREAYKWIQRALEVLEEGARRNPTSYQIHFVLADVYRSKLSERSVNRKTWIVLLEEMHADAVRRAKREGRPPPEFDRYLGLRKAREHYLLATRKPDITPSRKLLCNRLAVRCLERMGHWRQAETAWARLLEDLARSPEHGRESRVYWQHEKWFRDFMRQRAAFLLEAGEIEACRAVHASMKRHFGTVPGLRDLVAEEVRERLRTARDRKGSERLYELLREKLGETRSYEEVVKPPEGN